MVGSSPYLEWFIALPSQPPPMTFGWRICAATTTCVRARSSSAVGDSDGAYDLNGIRGSGGSVSLQTPPL